MLKPKLYLVVFNASDIELMLGFWLWRFKWACQNGALYIFNFFWHLRMREVLVNNNTVDQFSVIQFTTDLNFEFLEFGILNLNRSFWNSTIPTTTKSSDPAPPLGLWKYLGQ